MDRLTRSRSAKTDSVDFISSLYRNMCYYRNMHTDDVTIGRRIVELRQYLGWNQAALVAALDGRGLDWSQGTLSKVENGARPVRLVEARYLAMALEVTVEDLLSQPGEIVTERATTEELIVEARRIIGSLDTATERIDRARELLVRHVK